MFRMLLMCLVLSTATGAFAAGTHEPGTPEMNNRVVWFDLATTDLQRSRQFYHDMFGWEYMAVPEMDDRLVIKVGDDYVGSLRTEEHFSQSRAGVVQIQVANIATAVSKARALGGSVEVHPYELPAQSGWLAIIRDPTGQPIGLWSAPTKAKR